MVLKEEEALVFGFGVHALVGGDSFAFEDGFLWVVQVLFAEDLHRVSWVKLIILLDAML